MKRQFFFIPGVTAESRILEVALANTAKGDECFVHYHSQNHTCNKKCHKVELPKEDEGTN